MDFELRVILVGRIIHPVQTFTLLIMRSSVVALFLALMIISGPACSQDEAKSRISSLVLGVGGGTVNIGLDDKSSLYSFELGYNWRMSPIVSLNASFWFMGIESDPATGGSFGIKANAIPIKEDTKFSIYGLANASFGRATLTTALTSNHTTLRMVELGPGVEYHTSKRLGLFAHGTYSFGSSFFGNSLHFMRATIGTSIRL